MLPNITSITVCLELAGKNRVTDALRAYEKIRYERVRATQKTGETTRDTWHKADFDNLRKNPEAIKLKREDWILKHDAEKHAYAVFPETLAALGTGNP